MTTPSFNTRQLLTKTKVAFGTSGARGLVIDFTPEICAAFTVAFIEVMKQDFSFTSVAVGMDNRPSSSAMAQSCLNAIEQQGFTAIHYGVLPTPALAYTSIQNNIPCIMITGSHIPFDRNGLKFYRPDGEITKQDEALIYQVDKDFNLDANLHDFTINSFAADNYIKRYTSAFSEGAFNGKTVAIYEHSSAGRDIYQQIFTQLGAQVITLGRSDDFVPIDTEAVSEQDRQRALNWSKTYDFDLLFSTDGDGDRPLIADEQGQWLRGDVLGLIVAKQLNIEALAVPVSCNTAIESCNAFQHCKRTKIGSPYVIAEFSQLANKFNSFAGFEANGGFLLGSDIMLNDKTIAALPTRDAVLPAIVLLQALLTQPISQLMQSLPMRFTASDRLKDFPTQKSIQLIEKYQVAPEQLLNDLGYSDKKVLNVDMTDGLRVTLDNADIIHLRPSGNAPELRCYAESEDQNSANKLAQMVLTQISQMSI